MQTVRSHYTEAARGPTAQEISDEFSSWIQLAKQLGQENNHKVYITYDNPRIHPTADTLSALGLPAESDMGLPDHSPDLHQLVEHGNDRAKRGIMRACSKHGWNHLDPNKILAIVKGVVTSMPPESFRADLANLINCYRIVSTPEGERVDGMPEWVKGTGGGYPAHCWC